jgi:hypoxanthine phosphoribosyltransferase
VSLKDRIVLLVDDILDEGHTLKAIVEECRAAGVKEVLTVAILEKMHGREKATEADFIGLPVEDRYVFGFGMDYKEYLRNAPGIYAVKD